MKLIFNATFLLLASNCQSSDTMQVPDYYHLNYDGVAYPYLEYIQTKRIGLFKEIKGYFIHPIFKEKDRVLRLDYDETSRHSVRNLFGEELFGDGGKIYIENGIIRSDFFYMSVPKNSSVQSWKIVETRSIYNSKKNIEYDCKKVEISGDNFSARCARKLNETSDLKNITFKYNYDKKYGITYYEDFCGSEVCGYKLTNRYGIFSDNFVKHVLN